ncbi:MAG TPA: hypothetical protein VKH61_13935 [Streptosporangiaceae bacterium]|nr:hypothetical protein [Streptosporangiaceae bacterium]
MLGDAQVPQRLGHRALVADLCRQPARAFKDRHRGLIVTPDDLVEAADPEQRLGLAAHVREVAVQLGGALKQHKLSRILDSPLGVLVQLPEESRVNDPAARQGEIGLYPVQFAVRGRQRAHVAVEDCALVKQSGAFNPVFRAHRRLRPPRPRSSQITGTAARISVTRNRCRRSR